MQLQTLRSIGSIASATATWCCYPVQMPLSGSKHGLLHCVEPLLRSALCDNRRHKGQVLPIRGEHAYGLIVAAALRPWRLHVQLLDACQS